MHLGQLHSLLTCNLSKNFLEGLTDTGLSGCDELTDLDLSGNLLRDLANVEYLALVPSLLTLHLKGNPLAADKHYRCDWCSGGCAAPCGPSGM